MDREINDEINNHYQSNRSCYFFQSNMSLPDSEIYPFLESQCERDKQEFRKHGIFYEESEVKRGNQGICSEIKTIKSNSYMIEGKTYIKKICFITAPITENKKLLENISFTPKFIITLEHSDSTTIIMEKGGQNLRNYIKELDFKGEEFPAHLRTILFNNLRFFLTVLISEGFVYNDIKLENILFKLESKNEFMFIDYDSMFNIKDKNKSDYYIKIFCGDPAYFSPEKSIQFNNKKTDKNFISDLDHEKNEVYAFGLLMLSTFSHSNEMNFLNQVLSPDEKMKKIQEKISKINEKYKVWKKLITLMTCSNFLNRPNLNELNLKFIKLKNKNPESIIEKQNKYIKTIYFDGTINYKSKNENIKFQLNRSPNKEISFFNLENSFGIIFRDLEKYKYCYGPIIKNEQMDSDNCGQIFFQNDNKTPFLPFKNLKTYFKIIYPFLQLLKNLFKQDDQKPKNIFYFIQESFQKKLYELKKSECNIKRAIFCDFLNNIYYTNKKDHYALEYSSGEHSYLYMGKFKKDLFNDDNAILIKFNPKTFEFKSVYNGRIEDNCKKGEGTLLRKNKKDNNSEFTLIHSKSWDEKGKNIIYCNYEPAGASIKVFNEEKYIQLYGKKIEFRNF